VIAPRLDRSARFLPETSSIPLSLPRTIPGCVSGITIRDVVSRFQGSGSSAPRREKREISPSLRPKTPKVIVFRSPNRAGSSYRVRGGGDSCLVLNSALRGRPASDNSRWRTASCAREARDTRRTSAPYLAERAGKRGFGGWRAGGGRVARGTPWKRK